MGYTSIGFPSMGYTSKNLLNFSVLIVLLQEIHENARIRKRKRKNEIKIVFKT
jgi:hypothetical protein